MQHRPVFLIETISDSRAYIIGWISALPIEHTAARLFLDREHEPPEPDLIAATDNNAYTLSEIKGHKIVIAVLPHGEYGTSTAASEATNMLHSFLNIGVALMVGMGGGVPTAQNDIRLGDVVVSSPQDGKRGVYQYDSLKKIHAHWPPQSATLSNSYRDGSSAEQIRKKRRQNPQDHGCHAGRQY